MVHIRKGGQYNRITVFNEKNVLLKNLFDFFMRISSISVIVISIFSIFLLLTQISSNKKLPILITHFDVILVFVAIFFSFILMRLITKSKTTSDIIVYSIELTGLLVLTYVSKNHYDVFIYRVIWTSLGSLLFLLIIGSSWTKLSHSKFTLSQMIISSFVLAISLGSLLLYLPMATIGTNLSIVDSVFMATSAVCVTGLSVIDISKELSFFGQLVLLFLIQVGGLGIMSISAILILVLRARGSIQDRIRILEMFETKNKDMVKATIKMILIATFLIEAIGALILFFVLPEKAMNERIFSAIFHSISSFCNAGFSLYSDGLHSFVGNIPIVLTISMLIILGGIGYKVILTMFQFFLSRFFNISLYNKYSKFRIDAQTYIAVMMSILLIVVGTLFILYNEYSHSFIDLSLKDKILSAFFQSVSTRTAGFETVAFSSFTSLTLGFSMFLMFIGASPGGTGGGIKTTTFFIFLASVVSAIKNQGSIIVSNRRIPSTTVNKSVAIATLALTIWFASAISIYYIEKSPSMLPIMFETVSAMSTVGLSLGITGDLSFASKWIIVGLMFIGRVGYLTFFMSIGDIKSTKEYSMIEFPTENVTIG